MADTILITGSAGNIGTLLRRTLRRGDRRLRLLDRVAHEEPAHDHEEILLGSLNDRAELDDASRGVSAIIHLGGLSTNGYTFEEYLEANVLGAYHVLEAARRAGVPRVVYASSHHVTGFYPSDAGPVPDYLFPRPDSLYGVSKASAESLCSLYHDRYHLDTICLRIGSYLARPDDQRSRWSWLSPGDCTRLFEASLTVERPGFRVVWGVSANARGIVSLAEGEAIGYVPRDDAEDYLDARSAPRDVEPPRMGGPYVEARDDPLAREIVPDPSGLTRPT